MVSARIGWRSLMVMGLSGVVAGCAGTAPPRDLPPADVDKLLIVDCLLPPQVRKLGGQATYLTARRPVRTSAIDCEIRGGEYVAYDRADFATALKVWLPEAQAGNAEAQNYVGQIYERGLGTEPDYATAAAWYRRAAEQDFQPAQINLGNLYEKGLGVPRDSGAALNWYRRASGIDDELMYASAVAVAEVSQQELQTLRDQVRQARAQADQYRHRFEEVSGQLAEGQKQLEQLRAGQSDKQLLLQLMEQQPVSPQRDAHLLRLREELRSYDQQVSSAESELKNLKLRADRAERDVRSASQAVAAAQQGTPPQIEVIDPPVTLTRGMATAMLEPARRSKEIVGRIVAPAGVERFTVNGREYPLDEFNLFWADVELKGDITPVELGVQDRRQREINYQFMIQSPREGGDAQLQRVSTEGLSLGNYHALVIGNNRYAQLSNLETAVNDAERVAALLRDQYGFKTRLLSNANRYEILSALNDMRETLTEHDNLLIYYAGHGELDSVNERGYWLPVDAEFNNSANWISNVAITDIVNSMQAKHVLVVADSCYSGTLSESAVARYSEGLPAAQQREWLETVAGLRARTVLTSGGVQPVLDSGGGGHSIFARAFIETLEGNRQLLEGFALYRDVLRKVSARAAALNQEQTPLYAPIRHAGHEAGEFFFRPVDTRLTSH